MGGSAAVADVIAIRSVVLWKENHSYREISCKLMTDMKEATCCKAAPLSGRGRRVKKAPDRMNF